MYRVGLVNGIWDGKGFEQVTKTQGGGSHKGCNACDFPGTTFAHTVCYPFYSKFLPTHDPRRLQRPPRIVPNYSLLYNLRNEVEEQPSFFDYDDYIASGIEFKDREDKRILAINGVKGVWAFDVLPYARFIWMTKDRMHTGDHIVKDTLNMLSKTVSGHENRTEKKTVRNACEAARIFPCLHATEEGYTRPPWIANKYIEKHHDLKLQHVIGAIAVEVPRKIWKQAKGRTSQETLMYGSDGWANWCLYCPEPLPSDPYIDNKLKLFDLLRILNCSRIKANDVGSIFDQTIDALVEHSGLFPPTEQTYALHELVHIVKQITHIGPSKFNNLFMYERVNSTLKRMIKNKCNSMASIVKAYAVCLTSKLLLCMYFVKTCISHVLHMYFICILHVFLMYFVKTCISHVLHMYFICILHVFLMYFLKTCISHVFIMYFSCMSHVFKYLISHLFVTKF